MNPVDVEYLKLCENGSLEQIKQQLAKGADVHVQKDHAICRAAYGGRIEVVRYLIEEVGLDVHAWEDLALIYASLKGYEAIARYLCEERGANIKAQAYKALHWALWWEHLSIVRYFMSSGAVTVGDLSERDLTICSERGMVESVRFLLKEAEIDPNVSQGSPLRYAVINNREETVQMLLGAGADPYVRINKIGREVSAFSYAASEGFVGLVKIFVRAGADPKAENGAPLIEAALAGQEEVVRYMIDWARVPQELLGEDISCYPKNIRDYLEVRLKSQKAKGKKAKGKN